MKSIADFPFKYQISYASQQTNTRKKNEIKIKSSAYFARSAHRLIATLPKSKLLKTAKGIFCVIKFNQCTII